MVYFENMANSLASLDFALNNLTRARIDEHHVEYNIFCGGRNTSARVVFFQSTLTDINLKQFLMPTNPVIFIK